MKKFNVLLLAIFTLFLGTMLTGCLKDADVVFSQEEISLSVGDTLNVEDYMIVSGIPASDVTLKFSNSTIVYQEGLTLSMVSSGQSYVYATYGGSVLGSFKLVVKKPFDTVANIQVDDNGLVTWNKVSVRFDDTSTFTDAVSYHLDIAFYNKDTGASGSYTQTVTTNQYQLTDEGQYTITIYAEATGYFEDGTAGEATLYFGYMPELQADNFSFDIDTNVLTWDVSSWRESDQNVAQYSVRFNGRTISTEQTATSIDLTDTLEGVGAGAYTLYVTTSDATRTDAEGKISNTSVAVTIVKVADVEVQSVYSNSTGGQVSLTMQENADNITIFLDGTKYTTLTESTTTNFAGLAEGVYLLTAQTIAKESDTAGLFYANGNVVTFGYIYKLGAVSIMTSSETIENSKTLSYDLTHENALVATNIYSVITGTQNLTNVDSGFSVGSTSLTLNTVEVSAGDYSLTAYNYASMAQATVSGYHCYIINADASNALAFSKLASFENVDGTSYTITHEYVDSNTDSHNDYSVFNFALIADATSYVLYVQGDGDYEMVDSELYAYTGGCYTFTGLVEELFENYIQDGKLTFKIVAYGDDKTSVISSATTITLTILDAVSSSFNSDETTVDYNETINYTWNANELANLYVINYAVIDATAYANGASAFSGETTEVQQSETALALTAGHYYYIEIYALPTNDNLYLTSKTYKAVFYLIDQLSTPTVYFGYADSFVGTITDATGYFLKVENVANMSSLTVTLDGSDLLYYSSSGDYTIYLFTNDFTSTEGLAVSVQANSNDNVIHTDSEVYDMSVYRLSAPTISDLSYDDDADALTIKNYYTGITRVQMQVGSLSSDAPFTSQNDDLPNVSMANVTTSTASVSVVYVGNKYYSASEYASEVYYNTYEITSGTIYLDSTTTFSVRRISSPTDLTYYNGDLTFSHSGTSGEYFILDITLTDSNKETNTIKVKFDDVLKLRLNDKDELETSISSVLYTYNLFTSTTGSNGYDYKLNLTSLISYLENLSDQTYYDYYSNAVSVTFSVYKYNDSYTSPNYYISSSYSTLKNDSTSHELVVEKMASAEIVYNKSTSAISWSAVGTSYGSTSSETTYTLYRVCGSDETSTDLGNATTTTITLADLDYSTTYSYCLVTENPYYLSSAKSNTISLYKLSAITSVKLSSNDVTMTINEDDASYVYGVSTSIGGAEGTTTGGTTVTVTTAGSYTFTLVATTDLEDAGQYYINSPSSAFTFSTMDTLAPASTDVSYSNYQVTFSAFGESANLQSLSYLIVFVDADGNYAQAVTTTNSYIVPTTGDINNLASGNITIYVYAILSTYYVSADGTVYFAAASTLKNNENTYNAFCYNTSTKITKLDTPTITNITFDDTSTSVQRPTMKLTISGNYDTDETFYIYFGSTENDNYVTANCGTNKVSDGVYVVSIAFDSYADYFKVGKTTAISVYVTSSSNLPSSFGSAEVYRNSPLTSVYQEEVTVTADEENDDLTDYGVTSYYSQNIVVEFSSTDVISYAVGGIYLVITYTVTGGSEDTETILITSENFTSTTTTFTYSLSSFFKDKLANGGTLSYEVYINNYSNSESETYYLSCESITSGSYTILEAVSSDDGELSFTRGGFYISSSANSSSTIYVVTYGKETYFVAYDGYYYFEYPSDWDNDTYNLSVTAYESGKILSNVTSIPQSITRLATVSNVVMTRDSTDLNVVNVSWDAVTNAEYYTIRLYASESESGTYQLLNTINATTSDCSFNISTLLGDNMEKLTTSYWTGAYLKIEIVACTDSSSNNNSAVKTVTAVFIENDVTETSFGVTDYGELYFQTTPNCSYIYTVIASDRTVLVNWTQVTADSISVTIDLSTAKISGETQFYVRVIKLGDATTDGVTYNADIICYTTDSAYVTSGNFLMSTKVSSTITIDDTEKSQRTIRLAGADGTTEVYASTLSAFNSSLKENFVKLTLTYTGETDNNGNLVTIDLAEIIDYFALTTTTTIYLYTYGGNATESKYVVSAPTQISITMAEETSLTLSVVKLNEATSNELAHLNTYLVFDYTAEYDAPTVAGFIVKVEYLGEDEDGEEVSLSALVTVPLSDATTISTYTYAYAINLTQILRDLAFNEDMDGAGVYTISVSVIRTLASDQTFSTYITTATKTEIVDSTSPVTETGTFALEFTLLAGPSRVYMYNGDVRWIITDTSNISYYYIYVIDEDDANNLTSYATDDNSSSYLSGTSIDSITEGQYFNVYMVAVNTEDVFMVSSNEIYLTTDDGDIKTIIKNQINNEIEITSTGAMYIDITADATDDDIANAKKGAYDEKNFYLYLTYLYEAQDATMVASFIKQEFYYPFTFTISELLSSLNIRMRFTSTADDGTTTRSTKDVLALYFLASAGGEKLDDIITMLTSISTLSIQTSDANTLENLINGLKLAGGVGNYYNVFDDCFEKIQSGYYAIDYCLIGTSSTITSKWYELETYGDGEYHYIVETPTITATAEQTTTYTATYSITIAKVNLKSYDATEYDYVNESATTYIMRLKNSDTGVIYALSIDYYALGDSWTCSPIYASDGSLDDISASSISVSTDASGNLVLYLNLNNGNSLMGSYKSLLKKGSYTFEIYAQGNGQSFGSKSVSVSLNFFSACSSIKLENGTFTWTSYQNRGTVVVTKMKGETDPRVTTAPAGTSGVSTFSLDGDYGAGVYEYIMFYTQGGVSTNSSNSITINVDSETYIIYNLYKLIAPNVSSSVDKLSIDDSENEDYYSSYTEGKFTTYEVSNNTSSLNYSFYAGSTSAIYEAGTTGYDDDDEDFSYKDTESEATSFSVRSYGSTVSADTFENNLTLSADDANNNTYVLSVGSDKAYVCIVSAQTTIAAKMLNEVSDLAISDGVVTWSGDEIIPDEYSYDVDTYTPAYYVKLRFYNLDGTNNYLNETLEYYTLSTKFDISSVVDDFPDKTFTYIEVTVQALLVFETQTKTEYYLNGSNGTYIKDKQYAKYANGADVLRSNGVVLDKIEFSQDVENLAVTQYKLTWEWSGSENVTFIVQDEDGTELSGTVSEDDGTYTFTLDNDVLSSGEHTLYVYTVVAGSGTQIKSKGESIKVYKLADSSTEYVISTSTYVAGDVTLDVEIMDFSSYFDVTTDEASAIIALTYDDTTINITSSQSKVMILSSTEDQASLATGDLPTTYAGVIVIEDTLTFSLVAYSEAKVEDDDPVYIYSNIVDITLNRPSNNATTTTITWDDTTQTFSWTYTGYTGTDIVYVAKLTYYTNGMVTATRYYEVTETEIAPTIISSTIYFSLAIKADGNGLQSTYLDYTAEGAETVTAVAFSLFESGEGTSASPYVISTAEHFKNIKYRMSKSSELTTYTDASGTECEEATIFYFNITTDIDLGEVSGILFPGEFSGIITGIDTETLSNQRHTITYKFTGVSELTTSQTITVGQVKSVISGNSSTTYTYGASLFETVSSSSTIQYLTLSPSIESSTTVTDNMIYASLAIANYGEISNINFKGITNGQFTVKSRTSLVSVYSGLVGINYRTISACTLTSAMSLTDNSYENVFVAGVCFTNFSQLTSCKTKAEVSLAINSTSSATTHQIAGIVITSSGSASNITSCTANSTSVTIASTTTKHLIYIAGVAVYATKLTSGSGSVVYPLSGYSATINASDTVYTTG